MDTDPFFLFIGIPRLAFRSLCLQDSPTGVRDTDYNSVFPAGVNVAASWDRKVAYDRGRAMGQEHKGKGVDIQLGVCGDATAITKLRFANLHRSLSLDLSVEFQRVDATGRASRQTRPSLVSCSLRASRVFRALVSWLVESTTSW